MATVEFGSCLSNCASCTSGALGVTKTKPCAYSRLGHCCEPLGKVSQDSNRPHDQPSPGRPLIPRQTVPSSISAPATFPPTVTPHSHVRQLGDTRLHGMAFSDAHGLLTPHSSMEPLATPGERTSSRPGQEPGSLTPHRPGVSGHQAGCCSDIQVQAGGDPRFLLPLQCLPRRGAGMGDHTTREVSVCRLTMLPSSPPCVIAGHNGLVAVSTSPASFTGPWHVALSSHGREGKAGPASLPVLTSGREEWSPQGLRRVLGAPHPPLSFNAMDFPLALEESENFRGEMMRSWGGGWVTGIAWETCWSLGTRYRAGGPLYAPECAQSCVPRPVLSWAQATHHPEWTAAPRARCTVGQQGSQGSREVPSEPGQGYPWRCFSNLSPWAPRRPQCARGHPGPKADTGHRPEAVAALDDQHRGLSRAGAMRPC